MLKGAKIIKPYVELEKYNRKEDKLVANLVCSRDALDQLLKLQKGNYIFDENKYHDYDKVRHHEQISVIEPVDVGINSTAYADWKRAQDFINGTYIKMVQDGLTPEALKYIYSVSTATDVVMSANLKEWKEILRETCQEQSPANVKQLTIPIVKAMPDLFGDIPYDREFQEKKYAQIKVKGYRDIDFER